MGDTYNCSGHLSVSFEGRLRTPRAIKCYFLQGHFCLSINYTAPVGGFQALLTIPNIA